MFDVKIFEETVQRSFRMIKAAKMGKKQVQIKQVDGSTKMVSYDLLNVCCSKSKPFINYNPAVSRFHPCKRCEEIIVLMEKNMHGQMNQGLR